MKLNFRKWHVGDEETLVNIIDHYDRSFADFHHHEAGKTSIDEARGYIMGFVDLLYYHKGYACAIEMDGNVVGHVQIEPRYDLYKANCDLEIFLLPEACGKGIGTESLKRMIDYAFNGPLNFECLFVTLYEGNMAAVRMCEKAGLKFAGFDDSCDWQLHGHPCRKLAYGIRRPCRELSNAGVELKPWECRDIEALVHLFESVDDRYDYIPKPWEQDSDRYADSLRVQRTPEQLEQSKRYACREEIDAWHAYEEADSSIYRAILNNGEIVGLISVRMQQKPQHIDGLLGYMMMSEHCGKGIVSKAIPLMLREAFDLRPLHRVTALVFGPNKASRRVLEKNGFHLEGIQKEAVDCDGKPTDHCIYGILRSEFE